MLPKRSNPRLYGRQRRNYRFCEKTLDLEAKMSMPKTRPIGGSDRMEINGGPWTLTRTDRSFGQLRRYELHELQ
jgi:hypothetical protein